MKVGSTNLNDRGFGVPKMNPRTQTGYRILFVIYQRGLCRGGGCGSTRLATTMAGQPVAPTAYPSRSIFDLPPGFFSLSRLLSDPCEIPATQPQADSSHIPRPLLPPEVTPDGGHGEFESASGAVTGRGASGWTCHLCQMEFDSLQEQRLHFKSDFHRLNVKLHASGKKAIKEENFDELEEESFFKEYDVSSISGSEDESDSSASIPPASGQERQLSRQKIYIRLQSGETTCLWRCLLLDDSEDLFFENNRLGPREKIECGSYVTEYDVFKRLMSLNQETRDKTHLRIVLLACGGHFAGCVFDGNSIIAHKTFHRYVVRAKAGKKQSAKDATGKAANSAGSQLRRYNETALKKDIHELLDSWRPFFDVSSCIFIYAPSKNHQLLFDGEKPVFNLQNHVVRHIPMTVRRPTLKEAKRIYNLLTYLTYETDEGKHAAVLGDSTPCSQGKDIYEEGREGCMTSNPERESSEKGYSTSCMHSENSSSPGLITNKGDVTSVINEGTPLHEASKCGDATLTLELLEQGLNPCVKDARGRTPYMLASDKEVRNTFRRFMALNLEKWDWHAANVPSPLTKEMEESQAAKQAEKDAKRKAKAKELKKMRKAKEKVKAAMPQNAAGSGTVPNSGVERPHPVVARPAPIARASISVEEELKRTLAAEREKRAAAAERRIAAMRASATDAPAAAVAGSSDSRSSTSTTTPPSSGSTEGLCSCCQASLAGKVPFHRYHYKYCSTSCMHVHREMLEDG